MELNVQVMVDAHPFLLPPLSPDRGLVWANLLLNSMALAASLYFIIIIIIIIIIIFFFVAVLLVTVAIFSQCCLGAF